MDTLFEAKKAILNWYSDSYISVGKIITDMQLINLKTNIRNREVAKRLGEGLDSLIAEGYLELNPNKHIALTQKGYDYIMKNKL